ncbi:hypothetical protein RYX36_010939 [Vicia faba]
MCYAEESMGGHTVRLCGVLAVLTGSGREFVRVVVTESVSCFRLFLFLFLPEFDNLTYNPQVVRRKNYGLLMMYCCSFGLLMILQVDPSFIIVAMLLFSMVFYSC